MNDLQNPLSISSQSKGARRSKRILERQKTSVIWRGIHLLGSLQLALILLATIAVACAVATFYEAGFNAKIAQHYIYKAPWFIFWLGLLCINLFCVTLTRWPWEKKHLGFIITHYAIILLLIGGVVGSKFGMEGNVVLHQDRPPLHQITTSKSILQIEDPTSHALYIMPFDPALSNPTSTRPLRIAVPGSNWTVLGTEVAENLVMEQTFVPDLTGSPAVKLRLRSATAKQEVSVVLFAGLAGKNEHSLFGMAHLSLVETLPVMKTRSSIETQMVFGKYQTVSQGVPSGILVQLDEKGANLKITPAGGAALTYRLSEVLGSEIVCGADKLRIQEYWPNFFMENGKPASRGNKPENPALLVQIEHIETSHESLGAGKGLQLLGAVTKDGSRLEYQLLRDGVLTTSGRAALNEEFVTGWNDWTVTVEGIATAAVSQERLRPAREGVPSEKTGLPGFLAFLETGPDQHGVPQWVASGKITTLTSGAHFLRMGYGLQLESVPFTIRLVDFQVPRLEGTQTPAGFIATLEFRDTLTGKTKIAQAKMNHPASWPGGWWALLTGMNYKFSQAEWNPQDLRETTLQVLYDPGWSFKWIGSLGICIGIAFMFYWKPKPA